MNFYLRLIQQLIIAAFRSPICMTVFVLHTFSVRWGLRHSFDRSLSRVCLSCQCFTSHHLLTISRAATSSSDPTSSLSSPDCSGKRPSHRPVLVASLGFTFAKSIWLAIDGCLSTL